MSTPLDRRRSLLLVVDVQEAFRPVIHRFADFVSSISTLIQGAAALGLPIIATEQYPRGLGATVPEVAEHLAVTPLEKTTFAATGADGFELGDRDQVLLCGIEAHVCVHQTAQSLLGRGVEVQIVGDAVSSRTEANRDLGLARMVEDGATRTSVEMALFELLGNAESAEFRSIHGLVK